MTGWSEELRECTLAFFGAYGGTPMKNIRPGTYAAGFDRALYIPDEAEKLIPEGQEGKQFVLFSYRREHGGKISAISFLEGYDSIEEMIGNGWVID